MTAKAPAEVSTLSLDVYWASGRPANAELEGHIANCDACKAYLEHLDAAAETASMPAAPPTFPSDRAPRIQSFRKRGGIPSFLRWAAPVASLALAAGVVGVVRNRSLSPDGYVGVKGTPAVQILVHRQHETRIWDGRAPIRPGDSLALMVACEWHGHVAVASRGEGGWERLSEVPCPPAGTPLPFTLAVDGEPGAENLAVVLSPRELDTTSLRKAIDEKQHSKDVWVVDFVLPKEIVP